MILGDLEPEVIKETAPVNVKPRQDQGSIRDDVDKIVDGTLSASQCSHSPSPHPTYRSVTWDQPQVV